MLPSYTHTQSPSLHRVVEIVFLAGPELLFLRVKTVYAIQFFISFQSFCCGPSLHLDSLFVFKLCLRGKYPHSSFFFLFRLSACKHQSLDAFASVFFFCLHPSTVSVKTFNSNYQVCTAFFDLKM